MTTRDVLLKAAEIVEQGWCQVDAARDANGRSVDAISRDARQWCVFGAIRKAADMLGMSTMRGVLQVEDFLNVVSAADWNDEPERTQAEVALMLRKAADSLPAKD